MPEAVPQHQRLLNLATATINTSEQRNPIFATPSIRQLSGNISCSFICLMVGMRMPRLLSMFWLLVGAGPSNAKSKPVLTQRLAQPHSEVCQSLQGPASSSMNFVSCRRVGYCFSLFFFFHFFWFLVLRGSDRRKERKTERKERKKERKQERRKKERDKKERKRAIHNTERS